MIGTLSDNSFQAMAPHGVQQLLSDSWTEHWRIEYQKAALSESHRGSWARWATAA
jgi:hypothetical protein